MTQGRVMLVAGAAWMAVGCGSTTYADSIVVEADIEVEDLSLACNGGETDVIDEEAGERTASNVADDDVGCGAAGFARFPVLDPVDLEEELPDGVRDVEWSSVEVRLETLTTTLGGAALPFTDGVGWFGVVVTADPAAYDGAANPARTLASSMQGTFPAEGLLLGAMQLDPADGPLAEDLAGEIENRGAITLGDPEQVRQLLNTAWQNQEPVYALADAYVSGPHEQLPDTAATLRAEIRLVIDYEADVSINVLNAL